MKNWIPDSEILKYRMTIRIQQGCRTENVYLYETVHFILNMKFFCKLYLVVLTEIQFDIIFNFGSISSVSLNVENSGMPHVFSITQIDIDIIPDQFLKLCLILFISYNQHNYDKNSYANFKTHKLNMT